MACDVVSLQKQREMCGKEDGVIVEREKEKERQRQKERLRERERNDFLKESKVSVGEETV